MMRAKMSSNKKQPRPIDKKAGRTQCQMLFSDLMVTTTIAGRVVVTVQLNHDKKWLQSTLCTGIEWLRF